MLYKQVKEDLKKIVENSNKDVLAIYVSGSYSRGDYDKNSDLDVIIIKNKSNSNSPLINHLNSLKDKYIQFLDLKIIDFINLENNGNFLLDKATLLFGIDIRPHIHNMNDNEKKKFLIEKTLYGINKILLDISKKNVSYRRIYSNIGWMMKTIFFIKTSIYIDERNALYYKFINTKNIYSETILFTNFKKNPTLHNYLYCQVAFLKYIKQNN